MSSIREKLFKELLEKVEERQARLASKAEEANEKMAEKEDDTKFQKIWDLTSKWSLASCYSSVLPYPKDNEKKYYKNLQEKCEDFLREVRDDINYSLEKEQDFFLVASAEKYKVLYAVKVLKAMGYTVINDIHKGTWTDTVNGITSDYSGYLAEVKLF